MFKSIMVIILFFLMHSVCIGAITFTDGRWETTFADSNCAEQEQLEPSFVTCDGIESSSGYAFSSVTLVDGVTNLWSLSSNGINEWYYTGDSLDSGDLYPDSVSAEKSLVIGNIGALSTGEYAWGNNDSLSSDTLYIKSTNDPDSYGSGYVVAFAAHVAVNSDYLAQITTPANKTDGGGGKGARFWNGDGVNINAGTIAVVFPAPQQELWIRWYMRYEDGFKWDWIHYDKNLYINTGTAGTSVIPEFYGNRYLVGVQNVPEGSEQIITDFGEGWEKIMGGAVSDGSFHCYEVHLKMDTDQSDGVGRFWVDGILKASNISVDFSDGDSTAKLGWEYFAFESNQAYPFNKKAAYVDYDDIVVYNTTPPNTDADENPYIGPIGATPGPVITDTTLMSLTGSTTLSTTGSTTMQ